MHIRYLPRLAALSFAVAVATATLPTGAQAGPQAAAENARLLESHEAQRLARAYLDSIGFARPGTSVLATAAVGEAELYQDTWIVRVTTGQRLPTEKGVVLVDAKSGKIVPKLKKVTDSRQAQRTD